MRARLALAVHSRAGAAKLALLEKFARCYCSPAVGGAAAFLQLPLVLVGMSVYSGKSSVCLFVCVFFFPFVALLQQPNGGGKTIEARERDRREGKKLGISLDNNNNNSNKKQEHHQLSYRPVNYQISLALLIGYMMATTVAGNNISSTKTNATTTAKPKFHVTGKSSTIDSSIPTSSINQHHFHSHDPSSNDPSSSPNITLNYDCPANYPALASASLAATLSSYKYLDDYEYYRDERMKQNAMRNFGAILQSIKTKYKGCSTQSASDDENSDSDIIAETTNSEFSNFNRILKRHRKRFKQKLANHRRR